MAWVNIADSDFLSVAMMDDIYTNMAEINTALLRFGLSTIELEDNRVYYSISPLEILDQMNAVERNMQALHDALFYILGGQDKYFSVFIWRNNTKNRKARVEQWLDWLNDAFNSVNHLRVETLLDISGSPIADINGEPIYTVERM